MQLRKEVWEFLLLHLPFLKLCDNCILYKIKYHFGKSGFHFMHGRGVSVRPLGLLFCFPFCSPPVWILENVEWLSTFSLYGEGQAPSAEQATSVLLTRENGNKWPKKACRKRAGCEAWGGFVFVQVWNWEQDWKRDCPAPKAARASVVSGSEGWLGKLNYSVLIIFFFRVVLSVEVKYEFIKLALDVSESIIASYWSGMSNHVTSKVLC